MNIGAILHQLPESDRKVIRKKEKLLKKVIKTKYAIVFNQTCLKEDILPAYTHIKLYDQAVAYEQFTEEFRRRCVEKQVEKERKTLNRLEQEAEKNESKYLNLALSENIRANLDQLLKYESAYSDNLVKNRILNKLNKLYQGQILLPDKSVSFVNLSSRELSLNEKEFLDLGLNVHLGSKFNKCVKLTELELVYQSVTALEKQGHVEVNPDLRPQLLAEATKRRDFKKCEVLTPELKDAAKSLREDDTITVRKADKSSSYVVINKEEYIHKIEDILKDKKKFKKIRKDPTSDLKKKANRAIEAANAVIGSVKFEPIVGDFAPGYLYGTVKTHKSNNPLRPVISQIPTPTYKLAKRLNNILSPYIPVENTLKSSEEFLEVIQSKKPAGILASLDVESLFTNVPIDETTDIIIKYAFNHDSLPPPSSMSPELLKRMLRICTTEAPFRCPSGNLYLQIDGVAMGSPLGVLFANAYMCAVEDKVLASLEHQPGFYKRYIDDICLQVDDAEALEALKQKFEDNSVLKFTFEVEESSRLHFLDVDINTSHGDSFVTQVYRKPTDIGRCMNARSACPTRYKTGVIRTYVRRALSHCSTWELVHQELQHVKQLLVNNGYPCTDIDAEIKKTLDKHRTRQQKNQDSTTQEEVQDNQDSITTEEAHGNQDSTTTEDAHGNQGSTTTEEAHGNQDQSKQKSQVHKVFYMNQMNKAYQKDEQVMKNILKKNVIPKDGHEVRLMVYYKSMKTSNLVIRNRAKPNQLQETHVVYKYKCQKGDCKLQITSSYIGSTTMTLSRRLSYHLSAGGPAEHSRITHGQRITRQDMVDNTSILIREPSQWKLRIIEAAYIMEWQPAMCDQLEHRGRITLTG